MIKAEIRRQGRRIRGFRMSGHANYSEPGSDIVCAAVSMLTFNLIDTLTDIIKIEDKIEYSVEENLISLDIHLDKLGYKDHDVQLAMRSFELGLESVHKHYGDYIRLDYREV